MITRRPKVMSIDPVWVFTIIIMMTLNLVVVEEIATTAIITDQSNIYYPIHNHYKIKVKHLPMPVPSWPKLKVWHLKLQKNLDDIVKLYQVHMDVYVKLPG